MKRLLIFLTILMTSASNASAGSSNAVIATYKGGKVTESQVMQEFKNILDMQPNAKDKSFKELDPQLQVVLTRAYINSVLLLDQAKKLKVASKPTFQKQLETLKNKMLEQEVINDYVEKHFNENMVKERYDQSVNALKDQKERKVRYIAVDDEKKAQDIKTKLSKGTKFDSLVHESKDPATKDNKGEIGYISKGQVEPVLEEAIFTMKLNTPNVVKNPYGDNGNPLYLVIEVTDERKIIPPTKEQAEMNIKNTIRSELAEKYLNEIAKDANVDILIDKSDKK
ncbi:MAG: peptidylprolyl isomerase [Rickettsiaceae bacterium]